MAERVLVGMSGGVDSSVAAGLLIDKGYDTAGVTLELWKGGSDSRATGGEIGTKNGEVTCGTLKDALDAKRVCETLNIPHSTLDLTESFETEVICRFILEYKAGRTPNPCLDCNKNIKFGKMLELALLKGFDKIATGHYAKVEKSGDRFILKKPKDREKDQTYVLYSLSQHQLSHLILPLGDFTKSEIREIAAKKDFVTANRPDSQDICFVPDKDYAKFISRYTGEIFSKGNYLDLKGNPIGRHQGMIRYTIGQRKGLGMGFGRPIYVISKNPAENTVTLGDEDKLFHKKVLVNNLNFISVEKLTGAVSCSGKLRYRHLEQPCTITMIDDDTLLAEFDEPQRAPTPGQAAVFYDGDTVICGGTIMEI